MVLKKIAEKIIDGKLTKLIFYNWRFCSEIKQETLSLYTDKISALTIFTCSYFEYGSEAPLPALVSFVADTLKKSPPLTRLSLYNFRPRSVDF